MTQGDPVQNFLQSYYAPIEDAGFTALVMERADALVKKQARIRRWGLNAAFFIGGAVAAVQVPKLGALLSKLNESYNLAEVLPLDMRRSPWAFSPNAHIGVSKNATDTSLERHS